MGAGRKIGVDFAEDVMERSWIKPVAVFKVGDEFVAYGVGTRQYEKALASRWRELVGVYSGAKKEHIKEDMEFCQ